MNSTIKQAIKLCLFNYAFAWNSFSQTFRMLPDSNVAWTIQYTDGNSGTNQYHRLFTQLHKSVFIRNGKEYVELSVESYSNGNYHSPNIIGGYRNLPSGECYFLPVDSTKEYLLFDFSKLKGDTLFNVIACSIFSPYIAKYVVDSTIMKPIGARNAKFLFLHQIGATEGYRCQTHSLLWVEGIGSLGGGVLNQSCFWATVSGPLPILSRVCVNDSAYYSGECHVGYEPHYEIDFPFTPGLCRIPDGLEKIATSYEDGISMTQFLGYVTLKNNSALKKALRIADIFGRVLYDENLRPFQTADISIDHPERIYFIYYIDQFGLIRANKLMFR
jgi:hypothetical protein